MAQRKYMTAKQMMKHLGICKTTLRDYADKGLIGVWQPGGKNCAVRYYELEGTSNVRTENAQ